MAGEPLQCSKKKCGGWIKPDIVFFGEGLPDRFHTLIEEDFDKCDLCITMGTSLYVQEHVPVQYNSYSLIHGTYNPL